MVDHAARDERGPDVRPLTGNPMEPLGADTGRSRHELGWLVLFQFGAFVASAFALVPFLTEDRELGPGLSPILVSLCSAWPVLFAGVVVVARRRGRPWRELVGAKTFKPIDLSALALGVALQFAVGIAYFVSGVDNEKVSEPARELTDRAGGVGLGFAILAVFVVVGAPVFEELFYRGAVLNAVRGALGRIDLPSSFDRVTVVAIVVSSVWFAAIHGQLLQFPALVAVGVVCAVARVRTGRLATAVLLHAGFNLTSIISLGLQLADK